ncbi:hypothetical protein C667_02823 [Thauera phenylacetica B4P]|uniref:Uncharacterized protein n=1 Tax=Thauera phenylacetica B4P TaxID=1234382 RepID=N6ZW68_9RHOO|nr:hypothetical protein [Thauera phenylacetica]ENO98603.1 hypothetical protein C667_02823 [Thauera phenylacetica B4P]
MAGVQLALYKPHRAMDIGGRLICFWTRSRYSHVEVVIDGMCYSSSLRDGGVRKKVIDLDRPHWRVIPITWRDDEAALRMFERYNGQPYGYCDLIAQHVLRLPIDDPGLLCSELCALMLGLPESTARGMSPGALVDYVEMRNAK